MAYVYGPLAVLAFIGLAFVVIDMVQPKAKASAWVGVPTRRSKKQDDIRWKTLRQLDSGRYPHGILPRILRTLQSKDASDATACRLNKLLKRYLGHTAKYKRLIGTGGSDANQLRRRISRQAAHFLKEADRCLNPYEGG